MNIFQRMSRRRTFVLAFSLLSIGLLSGEVLAGGKEYIKFATLAPEGSTWMQEMHRMDKALGKATGNELRFKFYSGGVSGDEKDVIRKMRIGQVHGAGFTGVGLGEILPEVRVLDLPFLFDNDEQIQNVYEKTTEYFAGKFDEEGYVLLGWAPVGWIYFFSNYPVQTVDDLKPAKSWMWQGDPLVEAAYKSLNVSPFPLALPDVMLSLQTGMIDTFYASPVGALAFQWFTKVKYMSRVRMGNSTGAVLISKKRFNEIPEKHRRALLDIGKKSLQRLVQRTREDNDKSIEVMLKNGLKRAPAPTEAELARFQKVGVDVRKSLTGKLFSQELLDQVLAHLKEAQ